MLPQQPVPMPEDRDQNLSHSLVSSSGCPGGAPQTAVTSCRVGDDGSSLSLTQGSRESEGSGNSSDPGREGVKVHLPGAGSCLQAGDLDTLAGVRGAELARKGVCMCTAHFLLAHHSLSNPRSTGAKEELRAQPRHAHKSWRVMHPHLEAWQEPPTGQSVSPKCFQL